jgi:bile acid:Na+ symporter, BASS family
MEQTFITTVMLPVALGVIMLGLGLSLTLADFRRIVAYPRAAAIGLTCQMIVLPLACLGIAHAFNLSPPLAVGLMLLAASPGGVTANLYSHLAHGDVALNVTLTAINSVLSVVTLPLIVNFSLDHFMGDGRSIPLQFGKVLAVITIVLVPVALGMLLRARKPALTQRMDKPVRLLSAAFLVLVIVSAMANERENMVSFLKQVGLAALAFNLVSLTVGYVVPRLARVARRQAIAVGMEIGVHNGVLAIAIASSPHLLDNPTMAIPAAVYGVLMLFTAAGFGWLVSRGGEARPEDAHRGGRERAGSVSARQT